jgi:PAS domain S-box-containing protein
MVTYPALEGPIAVLLLEDSELDAELALSRLARAGLTVSATRAASRAEFEAALASRTFDIILADYALPGFDGIAALDIARTQVPEVPFIFVSGTLGEEVAVAMLQQGATDYVLKRRLERLAPAVQRAVNEARVRHERERASAALRASEEQARLALAAGRMVAWECDPRSGQLSWSEEAAALLGIDAAAVGGTVDAFLPVVAPQERERVRALLLQADPGSANQALEFGVDRADGTPGWLQAYARLRPQADGRRARVVGVAMDVTSRRRADEHLRQSQRLESIGRLAGGIAHETNNQMAIVLGFADFVLRRGGLPPDLRADVEQIRHAADRTAGITRQLLTFSRRTVVRPEVFGLNERIRSFEPVLRRSLGERCTLELALSATAPVRIDGGQLEQVLLNLTLNAVDALNGAGGRVAIETADVSLGPGFDPMGAGVAIRPGPYVLLAVTDTGSGMDRATLDRLFEPFFTTKEIGKGTGLGLATAYGIVKQAEGYIWASSEPGQGSRFEIFLPACEAQHPEAGEVPAMPRGTETVLVVEDEEHVRAVTTRLLREHGYTALEAPDGEAALAVLADGQATGGIDLVLTDLAMPRLGGIELALRIAQQRPALPVLLMSGYPEGSRPSLPVALAAMAVLEKPCPPDQLLARVRAALDQRPAAHAGARLVPGRFAAPTGNEKPPVARGSR